jgi:hypothetical protein
MFALISITREPTPVVKVLSTGDKWAMNKMAADLSADYIIRKIGADNYIDTTGMSMSDLSKWPLGLVIVFSKDADGLENYEISTHTTSGLLVTSHQLTPVMVYRVLAVEDKKKPRIANDTFNTSWKEVIPELKDRVIRRLPAVEASENISFKEELLKKAQLYSLSHSL